MALARVEITPENKVVVTKKGFRGLHYRGIGLTANPIRARQIAKQINQSKDIDDVGEEAHRRMSEENLLKPSLW